MSSDGGVMEQKKKIVGCCFLVLHFILNLEPTLILHFDYMAIWFSLISSGYGSEGFNRLFIPFRYAMCIERNRRKERLYNISMCNLSPRINVQCTARNLKKKEATFITLSGSWRREGRKKAKNKALLFSLSLSFRISPFVLISF